MKKIVSWSQTYGEKRLLNFQLLKYDIIGNYIRNKCEYIIFSFHNCPDSFYETCEKILKEIYSQDKLILLKFNNCSYLQCYKNILNKVKTLNCSDILQIQDDQHGINTKENIQNIKNIDTIIQIYKTNNNIKHLHLFSEESIPKPNLQPIEKISQHNVEIYKYLTTDFKKNDIYSWNDGTYIINLDLINTLLNIENIPDNVWNMEIFLKNVYDNTTLYRWGCNKILFKASNLFGKNINKKNSVRENLYRFFGETTYWETIIKLL